MGTLKEDFLSLGMELRETHISEVFLTADRVYKTKKPVQLGFLDFSTLALRKRYCENEVELNKRLAPHVYRGVVPITQDASGSHRIGGDGDPIEYAVEMHRLPDADAADSRLRDGRLGLAELERIATHIARFHAAARCDAETAQYGEIAAIEANVTENFEQTRESAREFLSEHELSALERWQHAFLKRERARFEHRVSAQRVRDGHGDLRLEHCYLAADGGVQVIDCIEFNERFRYGDVAADVAFLAMDLTWNGRHDLSEAFLAAYARASDDLDLYGVVDFYQSYRAYVRGKVAGILATDEHAESSARERAHTTARKYYVLSEACTREPLDKPKLYIVCGMIAAGKSSVTKQLQALLHTPASDADHVRKHLAGVEPSTPWRDDAFSGRYSAEQTAKVYDELRRRAEVVLRSGRSMILDASFRERSQRTAARELAAALGCECLFIECVAPPDVCRARLQERARGPSVSDGRVDIFDQFMASFEPLSELAPEQHEQLNTAETQEATSQRLAALVQRS